MLRLTTISDQRAWSAAHARAGTRIACVPTMGALHLGHLSLIARARAAVGASGQVLATIFVNPTQFDNPEDLEKYPRTLEEDCRMLAEAGCDAVFLPTAGELYPDGYCTFVEVVGPLTDKLCAVARPGHFRGVATIVTKLFNIIRPQVAIFGQKDLQQVMIINRISKDLDMDIEIIVAPTVREADGMAMSSRNRRLSAIGRSKALGLARGLEQARRAYVAGEHNSLSLSTKVYDELLVEDGVEVDYCDVVDLRGFVEVDTATDTSVLAVAAFVDGVRLIDHVALNGPSITVAD